MQISFVVVHWLLIAVMNSYLCRSFSLFSAYEICSQLVFDFMVVIPMTYFSKLDKIGITTCQI
jgi:hypothetical protein